MVNTTRMDDRALANDCLTHQKYLSSSYATMATETANDALFNDVMKICQDEVQANHKLFNFMNQRGWYQVQAADPVQINQARTQMQQMAPQTMV